MLGFPVPVPKNGDDFDATPVGTNLTYLLNTLQAYDASNISAGTIPYTAFDVDTNPRARYSAMFQSFILSGGLSSGFTVLAYSVPAITEAYFSSNGKRTVSISGQSFTAAINSDTYVSVNSSGTINTPQAVANNAAQPALPSADSQWLQKVISNGTTITSIVDLRNLHAVTPVVVHNPYKFSAYRNATYTFVNAAITKMPLDTKTFDTNSNFDLATSRFTAPIAGYYQFNGRVNFGASSTRALVTLYKNGVEYKRGTDYTQAAAESAATVSCLVPMIATDYIELFYYTTPATAALNTGSSIGSYLDGYLTSST